MSDYKKKRKEAKENLLKRIDTAAREKVANSFFDGYKNEVPIYDGDLAWFNMGDAIFNSEPRFGFNLYYGISNRCPKDLTFLQDEDIEKDCAAFIKEYRLDYIVNQ